ncbi:hypothetical protein A3H03_01325 [Candidatus Kuenenbacteria bacterium RIFCSPLOWO2_12_FULL_42_13]|uniref:Uncharacterized protein n=4 Tax=Candidatus Kueneniibacteriota TaxID=1752740 RepID=A0A1F6G0B2_9BACT|nr:MAG: hypothetical protein A3C68_02175 [Candidatus Kuenenbacteria bacterium RIFCSPHIGHO2_02_FULL_42_29]OGG90244.1 MAG: hypothetical protein A3H55_01250 [Candidatus Kuenenbacteria bacterium RIFCSPLOWO2_02_FULL_42_16]OGG91536.1 MAG: hypothetical protein A3H03_01325 [Candidatus Kuenenbacteria bacterium RIFCSPLOWO2_12_FULL_42_13]OGG95829.1 MAG: hypothetical protein A2V95_00900 [Candidatus Kuenenbacteria bacterium RBG_16_41_7]OGG99826.1 MAG: hypothetical protein A3E04_03860 [Candidatus Kuenenbacte
MKYIYSLLAIIAGFLLVRYSNYLVDNFGHSETAEHYLGTYGGSRLMWKLIGLIIIIGALLTISGLAQSLIYSIFKPMVGGLK